MITEVQVDTSMQQEFSHTMSGLVRKLIGKNGGNGTSSKELLRKQTYNLMKQLARKIVYQNTDKSMNGETKTELTEFSMRESVFTYKKKKKECVKSQVLKQNTRSLHYSNICEMIKNNTTKLIRNKLTLHEKSKKIIKKRTYNREKSLTGNIESMEKLLSCWKKDFKKKSIVGDLKWSMKSTYKSYTMQNEIMEQEIMPVAIVPPLPLPMWARALDEPPQPVYLRRTPSLDSLFDSRGLRAKLIMRRRMRNAARKPKPCVIPAETLARALANPKWNKGPRQVPVSTFQATRIHYRFLLAKYGKSRLMGRQRVYPNSIKSNVHSNFSIINLLHDVEEAISQNKYSKETDKIVKNFKEELNRDLLYNESINRKYHKYQMGNPNNSGLRKKNRLAKISSIMSLTELVEKLGGNDSEESCDDVESDVEVKSEICIETEQSQNQGTNNQVINSLVDSDSNSELFRSFNNEILITDASTKLKNNTEDMEASKVSQNKKFVFKEKKTIKKKKALIKEPKVENISEEERLNAILQELQKQVKVSEPPTPIFLTKNDSLTELNFEKEPSTYLSMHASSITTDSDSQSSHLESPTPKESPPTELSEQESNQSLVSPSESKPIIKKNKPPKNEPSSTKLYSFRIDYECIKNKPMSICNIITALERVNKLLQNIPIQYDKNTGRPYIVYDPKTIVKVIKEVNIKQEYKMIVKKSNKKARIDSDTEKSICETNAMKTSTIETTVKKDEKGLEEVGNQLLQYILVSMESKTNPEECVKDKDELNKYSQTLDQEKSNIDQSFEDITDFEPIMQTTESLKSPNKNIEAIEYKKKYFEIVIKTASAYHITGFYHQSIIYMERKEYLSDVQPNACQKDDKNIPENNQNIKEEKNTNKFSISSYAELKEKVKEELKKRMYVPNEVNKKYGRHFTNENHNQTESNISQKHYHRYSKTRKLLLSKYDFKRNGNKESVEKGLTKINRSEIINNHERDEKKSSFNKQSLPNNTIKLERKIQIKHPPTECKIEKTHIVNEKMYRPIKEGLFPCMTGENIKNNAINGHNRLQLNPLITIDSSEQIITNKNDLLINKTKNNSGLGSFGLNKSTMNDMLRSVSINTIPNTYPTRKEVTKQVFYFQITYPNIDDLNDIYKKQSPQEFLKPLQHDIFSKFIYYKENSKLQMYKNYQQVINQQVIDSVNRIKNHFNNNIDKICQIVNVDNQILIQFLKICLKQNELDFYEDKKLLILETEMEELKSLLKKHLGTPTINIPRLILREPKRSSAREQQKVIVLGSSSKINRSKKEINKPVMSSVNTIKNDLNKNINSICQIANINNQLLINFLNICLKRNKVDIKEDEKLLILEKEMEELKSYMKEHLGKNINPLRLIQKNQKGPRISGYKNIIVFHNSEIKQSFLKNELNMEEININHRINNNSLCSEILRFLNFIMLIFSLFSFLQ